MVDVDSKPLGPAGSAECSVALTSRPWELPIDALVVSVGPAGLGQLGHAVRDRYPEVGWERVDLASITPDKPVWLPVSESLVVVLASVREPPGLPGEEGPVTSGSLERAVRTAVVRSVSTGATAIGMPLLGAGVAGLPPERAAGVIVPAVRAALGGLGPRAVPVTFVCQDEQARRAVTDAWGSAEEPGTGAVSVSQTTEHVLERAAVNRAGAVAPAAVLWEALTVAVPGGRSDVAGRLLRLLIRTEPAALQRLGGTLGRPYPPATASPVGPDLLAVDGVRPLVDRATAIAVRTDGSPTVHQRHLLAAVVTGPLPPDVHAALGTAGAGDLRLRLREAVEGALPDAALDRWDEVLGLGELAGGISADLVDPTRGIDLSEDHLGVRDYVTMLATVVADRHTPLPLSIGLFGEWGSGKSYFMGLLRGQVSALARRGEPYCSDIVQIGFNAWHYADTNLWASLGNQIFAQLAGPGETADARRDRLRVELAEKLQRGRDLRAATENARKRAADLRTGIDEARRDRRRQLKALAQAPTLRAELSAAGRRLGVDDPVEQGELLVRQVRGTGAELGAWRRAVVGRRGVAAVAALGVAVLLLVAGAVVAGPVGRWLAGGGLAVVTGLLAVAGALVARVRSGLRTIAGLATDIRDGVDRQLDAELAELRDVEATEQVLGAQLEEVVARVGELGRELAELSPGQRLYGFVTERAASADYRRELGLISTVRQDFEQLIALMKEWRKSRGTDPARRPIDRIVLYIDDLDRCSPEQVVDVLQAVHLLLALELFVVVVGVDPRWLLHSLSQQYRGTLTGEADPTWRATPLDYLEKIFNIPFVLPRLTPASFGTLIRDLSRRPAKKAGEEAGEGDHATPDPVPAAADTAATGADPARVLPVEAGSEVAAVQLGEPAEPRSLTDAELALLESLAPLVRSPREAKRLLNLYRMVRSTRNLSAASRFLGTDGRPGDFEAVAVLLGVLTAYPRRLRDLLDAPANRELGLPGGICVRDPGSAWPDVVAGLRPRPAGDGWVNDVSGGLGGADRVEWSTLVDGLGPATALMGPHDLTAFREWGPHIARFSFVLSPLASAALHG